MKKIWKSRGKRESSKALVNKGIKRIFLRWLKSVEKCIDKMRKEEFEKNKSINRQNIEKI